MTTTAKKTKTMQGVIVSDKMKDTVVVAVNRFIKHPKYGKFIEKRKKFKADDPGNVHRVGERVTIEETKPISKDKHFKIITANKLTS